MIFQSSWKKPWYAVADGVFGDAAEGGGDAAEATRGALRHSEKVIGEGLVRVEAVLEIENAVLVGTLVIADHEAVPIAAELHGVAAANVGEGLGGAVIDIVLDDSQAVTGKAGRGAAGAGVPVREVDGWFGVVAGDGSQIF